MGIIWSRLPHPDWRRIGSSASSTSINRLSTLWLYFASQCRVNHPPSFTIAQSIPLTPFHLRQAEMVLRQTLGRHASRAIRPVPATRRGLASPASGSFSYQTGEAAGVKFASRDLPGPTATVALVAKAGTRYQSLPGLAEGLEKYAFRVLLDVGSIGHFKADINALFRIRINDQLFVFNVRPNFSVPPSSPTTHARALSLEPNSSATIFHTSSRH